jgi:hypothetical protein
LLLASAFRIKGVAESRSSSVKKQATVWEYDWALGMNFRNHQDHQPFSIWSPNSSGSPSISCFKRFCELTLQKREHDHCVVGAFLALTSTHQHQPGFTNRLLIFQLIIFHLLSWLRRL